MRPDYSTKVQLQKARRNICKQHYFLDSVYSAQEVAYILRGLWDECNAVTFTDFDKYDLVFETAV